MGSIDMCTESTLQQPSLDSNVSTSVYKHTNLFIESTKAFTRSQRDVRRRK